MFPFEFRIKGPPVSSQTRNRRRLREWREAVRNAAEAALPNNAEPSEEEVSIVVTYFYEGDTPDVDNIIKPIQDALNGLVFVDDSQVIDTRSRKRSLNGAYRLRGISAVVLLGFTDGEDFLHIRVDVPTGLQDLD